MPAPEASAASARKPAFSIVGVGASAGGIEAFVAVLQAMPDDTGVAFVFVLHMAASHHSVLAEILGHETRMKVAEVQGDTRVEPNHVYVIPPGRAMDIRDGVLLVSPKPAAPHYRSIDHFLTTLADDQGHRAIGVILSGTATDGTLGLEAIKAAGGVTFAQDTTAQQSGMPQSAASAGCVDFVLPPAEIAREITRISRQTDVLAAPPRAGDGDGIERILAVLKRQTGVDFTQYRSNTLHRRIRRRMVLQRLPNLAGYARHLAGDTREVEALYQDILISVTSFFRDPEAFETLKTKVFPPLFADRSRHDPVRAWVLGCSSGEEAYSIAIALKEYATEIGSQVQLCLYATDLNSAAIDKARAALYPKEITRDVSPERLRRFFVEADGGYRIAKAIRDICIFARQNVLADPPFSHMDLITCRNVLIYMEPALQRRLLPILHYALNPSGFLLLGRSESTGSTRDLFELEDARNRLFRKVPAPARFDHPFPVAPRQPKTEERRPDEKARPMHADPQAALQREAERVLFTRYVPVGVLVDTDNSIIQYRGDTGLYLSPAPGRASHDLLKMAREGLLLPLRAALQRARKSDAIVHEDSVRVRANGAFNEIAITVVPVKAATGRERCYWVLFEPRAPTKKETGSRPVGPGTPRQKDAHIQQLVHELAATREYLQSVIEQQEAANEELQSANEEVQSANEELQSINEELETSKEEIQSSNEELTTVNEELHNRNEELNRVNSDLNNLLSSAHMAIVMVGRDLRIRRFTPLAEKIFNLIPSDTGRPFSDIKTNFEMPDARELLAGVIDTMAVQELEVRDTHGRWHLLRVRPYRTLDDKIDGAVIALTDIESLKQNQETLARQAKLLEQTHEAIFVRELNGTIVYWNRGAERLYGYSRDDATGRLSHELLGSTPAQTARVREALEKSDQWVGELARRTRDGRDIVVDSDQSVISELNRKVVLVVERDVTERKQLEQTLQRRVEELAVADRHKNEFLAMLAHELRNPLAPLRNAMRILRDPATSGEDLGRTRDLMDRQITKISRLVDDLLDAARITRGQVQLRKENVDLQMVVQRALEMTRDLIDSRDQRLSVVPAAEPIVVNGDPLRLEQIFGNLLNNASKYTGEKGEIAVTTELARHEDGHAATAVVRIRDNGVGISAEMLPRVFELFMQADRSLARTQGGLGIGLSLARSLVELHGGRMTAHSDGADRGSEFTVYLPTIEPARQKRPSFEAQLRREGQATEGEGPQAVRILVVDDNADIVESTSLLLRLQGIEARSALSASEALEIAASFRPSIVLLDIGMPDIDGYTLAPMIRAQPGLEDVVLAAMSGYGSEEDRRRARECGFDHHLTKPVDPERLNALIRLSQSQPRRLKNQYGSTDDATIIASAAHGPHGS